MTRSVVIALAALVSPVGVAPAFGQEAIMSKRWHGCARCHQPPDEKFASDRAWLGQILETS